MQAAKQRCTPTLARESQTLRALSADELCNPRERLQARRGEHGRSRCHNIEPVLQAVRRPRRHGHDMSSRAAKYLQILPIRDDNGTLCLEVARIDWIDAAGDYMCVHADGRTYVLRETMKSLEALLDPQIFQRVHRSTIVNVQRVRRLRPHTNGEYFLTLDDGRELKLSRSYRDRVDRLLRRHE